MRFVFSRRDAAEPPSAFDLGDLEVTGLDGSVTSAGRQPDQAFMVYPGIVDLADGLTELAEGARGSYEFVGPDSSFTVDFRRKGDRISATAYGGAIGTQPVDDVLAGLRVGVDDFLAADPLDPAEPGAGDLAAAVSRLHQSHK